MSTRKAIQDAYMMRITWEAAGEIADQQDAEIAALREVLEIINFISGVTPEEKKD